MLQHDAVRHRGAVAPRPQLARRLRLLVLCLGALAGLAVAAGTALSLWHMHQEITEQAEDHLRGIVQVLGEQTLRSAHAIDAILRTATEDALRSAKRDGIAPTAQLHLQLRETIAPTPYVRALMVTDTNGKLVAHTSHFPPPNDAEEIEFVRNIRDARLTRRGPLQPIVRRLEDQRGIMMSRALEDADAQFLGVITAVVDPDYFLGPQGLPELGPDGVIRLLRGDGLLLTGYPMAIAAAAKNYRNTALFSEGIAAGNTLIHHVGIVTHIPRVSAVYQLKDYPLVVTATTSVSFILRTWNRSAWLFGSMAAATELLLVLITLWLARQLRIDEELKSKVMESQERLNAIIQSAMDAIVTVDERRRIVLFNAAAEQIFRCTSEEAIGADIGRFLPDFQQEPGGHLVEIDDTGATMLTSGEHLALTGVRAAGGRFPIEASVSQVRLHGTEYSIVILRDVTERKRVEAALRENERRYRTLFSKAMDGILLLDANGDVVDVNESFARMHGYSVDELLTLNLRDLDTPKTLALAPERMRRIFDGETLGFEVEHYHKDGHILPMDVASSVVDIDGRRYFLAFHRDITDRRRAEQEIRRSQEQLRGLSKAANEALEAERRRTARELHDELGQSLTALKMDLDSLRSALPPELPDLDGRAQAMHALLDGTIAATRRIAADLRPLMLDDLGLAAALDWLTQNFSKHTGIATDLVIDDSVAQVPEPIASALYRITQESLTNVAKYAHASATEIQLERDGEWVRLSVRDNGRGIAAADQEKRGTFGLLGIRERVTLLGGDATISGEPGRGSEVQVRIPLAAASQSETIA